LKQSDNSEPPSTGYWTRFYYLLYISITTNREARCRNGFVGSIVHCSALMIHDLDSRWYGTTADVRTRILDESLCACAQRLPSR